MCYADDTLVIGLGRDVARVSRLVEVAVATLARGIQGLGLSVSPPKTEVVLFHGLPLSRLAPQAWIRVGDTAVRIGERLKFLGLDLDGRWRWEGHFGRLVPRIEGVTTLLGRLLPNLGGPGEGVRRPYTGVVRAMALYGSPVWAPNLATCRRSRQLLRSIQRRMAVRIARGYRTLSHDAAVVLARVVPFELQAVVDAEVYRRRQAHRRECIDPPPEAVGE